MTTDETSSETYHALLDAGVISNLQAEVYRELRDFGIGGANQQMVYRRLLPMHPGLLKDTISPRFATLEAKGLVRIINKAKCPFTDRQTAFYVTCKPTGQRVDTPAPKRKTVKALEARIIELERTIAKLGNDLAAVSKANSELADSAIDHARQLHLFPQP